MILAGSGLIAVRVIIGQASNSVSQQNLLGDARGQGDPVDLNGPINLLLVGLDLREEQHDDSVRADTVMIVHIPAAHDQIMLVSLPRDLHVKIPDYPKTGFNGWSTKINAAFQGGYRGPGTEIEKRSRGMELLALTIKNLTGITFDGAAIIDFAGFEAVIAELGGVTMCVDRQGEAIHLARDANGNIVDAWYDDNAGKVRGIPDGGSKLIYEPGCQHMDARLALEYSRLRKGNCCPQGDYDRQRHQQQLIKAIIAAARQRSLLDLAALNRLIRTAGKAFVLDTQGVPIADYLFTFKDLAASDMTVVRTNAGQVNTLEGTSDELLTDESKTMFAALRSDTLLPWLADHPDFVGSS